MLNNQTKVLLASVLILFGAFINNAFADCFDGAARYHHVNPRVLRSIAMVESHDNPRAINHNRNGTVDYGIMQINSMHLKELKRYGIRRPDLMNTCKNIYTGAWILHQKMLRYGNTWRAIGAYHSETPHERNRYARKVELVVDKMAAIEIFRNQ